MTDIMQGQRYILAKESSWTDCTQKKNIALLLYNDDIELCIQLACTEICTKFPITKSEKIDYTQNAICYQFLMLERQ